jgi:glycosyltransferase involved in cell wall biosynthesis
MEGQHQPYTFVSFSYAPWSDVWLNRQHIMSRLARMHRVLFFSRIPLWKELLWKLKIHEPIEWRPRQIAPTLKDLRPVPWFPRIPGWPDLDRFFVRLQAARIRRALRRAGWDNRILYVWEPALENMVGRFDERLVCFHCYDDYTRYTWLDAAQRREVANQVKRLVDKADLVFAAGEAMAAQLGRRDVHVIPNGVDYELFATAHEHDEPPPPEMARMPHPIVAHIGRLQTGLDFGLLGELARRRRDWSVMLLGPIPGTLPRDRRALFEAFRAEPNAYYIEGKPVGELPRYLRHVDVGLMAYKTEGWLKTAFPLKLFEYMAAGKPSVSPPLDECVRYRDIVAIADSVDEWIAAIEHWLASDSEELAQKRMAIAKANSWDVRCRRIVELIDSTLDPGAKGGRR